MVRRDRDRERPVATGPGIAAIVLVGHVLADAAGLHQEAGCGGAVGLEHLSSERHLAGESDHRLDVAPARFDGVRAE